MLFPVLLFVFGTAMGIATLWDIGGVGSRVRARLERERAYKPWWPKAWGVWCILFSVGELVYFYGFTHGMWS